MKRTYATVPKQLKDRDAWVNSVNFTKSNGQKTKIPVNPKTGRFASVKDPDTWSSFEIAVQRAQIDPHVSGIGYVFSHADPYAGIDFDHCRDPQTGEIDPVTLKRIELLDSYSEISVSGKGVHVIVKASLSGGGCRNGNVEIYDNGRFFVVTGDTLVNFPSTVNCRQAELDRLHGEIFTPKSVRHQPFVTKYDRIEKDEILVTRIKCSRQGEKFSRLLNGDFGGYASHSEADLAFCGILSFWTQDAFQIDRIFRKSGLYRDKWDQNHGQNGSTYGEMTIQKAITNHY